LDTDSTIALVVLVLSLFFLVATALVAAAIRVESRVDMDKGVGETRLPSNLADAARLPFMVLFTASAIYLTVNLTSFSWPSVLLPSLLVLCLTAAILLIAGSKALSGSKVAVGLAGLSQRGFRAIAWPYIQMKTIAEPHAPARPTPLEDDMAPSKEVMKLVADLEEEAGLDKHGGKMIRAVLELDKTTAREIMVPRIDIKAVSTGSPMSEVNRIILEEGHSRVPLYDGTVDHIVGVIYARDVLKYTCIGEPVADLRTLAKPAYFIPETKNIRELLREFQERRVHLAIVVDEHGGTAGLVSLEDLLEEIVGDIEEEFEPAAPLIVLVNENEALLDGRALLDEINEKLSLHLTSDGFDTLGGFVLHHLGKMPKEGDIIRVDVVTLEVLATLGRRVKRVKLTKSTPSGETSVGQAPLNTRLQP